MWARIKIKPLEQQIDPKTWKYGAGALRLPPQIDDPDIFLASVYMETLRTQHVDWTGEKTLAGIDEGLNIEEPTTEDWTEEAWEDTMGHSADT